MDSTNASPPPTEADDVAQVPASMVLGTMAAFGALGMEPAELARISGLSPEALQDPDGWVEPEPLYRLWEAAVERFSEHPVGLTLARESAQIRRESLGVFGYAVRHCRDVRQSVELFVRYGGMVFPGVALQLQLEGDHAQLCAEHDPRAQALVEPVELLVASMAHDLPGMNPQMPRPTQVCFRHARKHPPEVYARLLGVPVRFGADWSGLCFEAAALELPVTGADPQVGKYLQQHAEAQLVARPASPPQRSAQPEPLDARVRAVIDDNLMAGTADQAMVARALGVSTRTLQRRLEERGTSFARQLEQVRRERALQLLALPHVTLGEVAFCLGYGSPRAFYRSFRRWTGQTPSEYRRRTGQ